MSKIIIIGAGVAGLSAGIYGLMNGYEVDIYERHYKAGGNLTGWDRKGYHIDNCIHWLTGTNKNTQLYKTWEELGVLGNNIKIYQGDTLFTYKEKNKSISLYSDFDKSKNEMLSLAPEDKKEIESFFKAVATIEKLEGIYGKNNNEKANFIDKILAVPHLAKYYFLNTKQLSDRFKNPILKKFITSIISEHFSSLALIIVYATFIGKDGGIPAGSSCKMAKRMEEKFKSLGGNLYLKSGVNKINIEGNKAISLTLESGNIVNGNYIIITGDPKSIFNKLLDNKYMPKRLQNQYKNPKMKRFSTYHCAYSCNLKDIPFKGDIVLQVPIKYQSILKTKYIIVREFSHEKEFSLKDTNILQVMVYCFEKDAIEFINLSKKHNEYLIRKNKIANIIKEIIIEEFEQLNDTLEIIDTWTPATYKRYTDAQIGSFMSFVLPAKTFPLTTTNKIKGLKNVILASQWLQSPGGLPIAAKMGKRAIDSIIKIK